MSNLSIRIASAPVSWGVMEDNEDVDRPLPEQVMAEIRAAGYEGTELGPFGFYPTDVTELRIALMRHRLTLTSAFVMIGLFEARRREADLALARRTAEILHALGCPFIVLADALRPAGEDASPSDAAWREAAQLLESLAREFRALNLSTVFHLESDSHLASPDDLDRLCRETNPDLIGICLDTGHHVYNGGDPRAAVKHYGRRIRYVHLKDVDLAALARVRSENLDFYSAVRGGVFTPLGLGGADIAGVVEDLRAQGYTGWFVAEQDRLTARDAGGRTSLEAAQVSRQFLRSVTGV
jgi:inosose dehydratase